MDIADARQAFFDWNEQCITQFIERLAPVQKTAITLLPLLFQTNNRFLPGYNGADVPAGIYSYVPAKTALHAARKQNNRFSYQQDAIVKHAPIEAIFLQQDVIDNHLTLWLLHDPGLNSSQYGELNAKLTKVAHWLGNLQLKVDACLLSSRQLALGELPDAVSKSQTAQGLFLDAFYLEAMLIAGKYPAWWLVPPEKEAHYDDFVAYIKQHRFVKESEFIDLGSVSKLNHADLVQQSVSILQAIKQSSEHTWLRLLQLYIKEQAWPEVSGSSWLLKKNIYSMQPVDSFLSAQRVTAEIIQSAVTQLPDNNDRGSGIKLLQRLGAMGRLNKNLSEALSTTMPEYAQNYSGRHFDLIQSLSTYSLLDQLLALTFRQIVDVFNIKRESDEDVDLAEMLNNISAFISRSDEKVAIYNTGNSTENIQERIRIRYQTESATWSLLIVLEEGQEETLYTNTNLLAVIAWAWFNRLADQSTQVSIDCPSYFVTQIEARHVLEVLMMKVQPDMIWQTSTEAFEHPARPLRSIVFVSTVPVNIRAEQAISSDDKYTSKPLQLFSEQLTINSWGEIHIQTFRGYRGFLQCLSEWFTPAYQSGALESSGLEFYGYASGAITSITQNLQRIQNELVECFGYKAMHTACLIVSLDRGYYRFELDEYNGLQSERVGADQQLLQFLQQPLEHFRPVSMGVNVLANTPLSDIYKRNQSGVVQVYFQLRNRTCETWVLDERGSLWHDQCNVLSREVYVAQWLYFIRNINDRMRAMLNNDTPLPALSIQQISINQLGGYEFYTMTTNDVLAGQRFFNIKLIVYGESDNEQVSLLCDDREFHSIELGERVVGDCVAFLQGQMQQTGPKSVYVSDVDAPLNMFLIENQDEIQTLHFLNYKYKFEHEINQLLGII